MKELKSHELDFYSKYIIDPKKKRRQQIILLYSLPAVVLVSYLGYTVYSLIMEKTAVEADIAEQYVILGDSGLLEGYGVSMSVSDTLAVLDGEVKGMELYKQVRDTYPTIGKDTVISLFDAAPEGVKVTSVSFTPSSGQITVQAEAADVKIIPEYIDSLKNTGILESADYSGYNRVGSVVMNEDGSVEIPSYQIYVQMKVKKPVTNVDFNEYFTTADEAFIETEEAEETEE